MNRDNLEKHAVFIGTSGFPFGLAAVQRQKLLAKALIYQGWRVTVICHRSVHLSDTKIPQVGHIEGMMYVYIYNPHKSDNFILRNLQKVFSPIFELIVLKKIQNKYGISSAIVFSRNFFIDSFQYFIFSKLLKFKLLLNLVEIYQGRKKTPLKRKVNDYLFNKLGLYFYDAYLPISRVIIEYFKSISRPYHYLPVIVNSDKFTDLEIRNDKFFLYCGSAAYYNSIEFILKSYLLIKDRDYKLILVVNGSKSELDKIINSIYNKSLGEKVILKKNLSDKELYSLYKSAVGLLLPLSNSIQDKARFPHKLAEYLASGRIVLSNPIGEINYYLKDKENVLFSPSGEEKEFAKCMAWVLDNPQQSKIIGENGQKICLDHFDYRKLSYNFNQFLLQI